MKEKLTDVDTGDSREIFHFHYTTWPDFGVPQSPTAFLKFLMVVRESGALDENVGPPVVHCSAGIGRSGTFCLVDSCLVLIERAWVELDLAEPKEKAEQEALLSKENHKEANANKDDEDSSEEEVQEDEDDAPPLPPPRGDSLGRSEKAFENQQVNNISENH
ncbi:hypothetical protein J437_LFUL006862, partial [Ladona fulva]